MLRTALIRTACAPATPPMYAIIVRTLTSTTPVWAAATAAAAASTTPLSESTAKATSAPVTATSAATATSCVPKYSLSFAEYRALKTSVGPVATYLLLIRLGLTPFLDQVLWRQRAVGVPFALLGSTATVFTFMTQYPSLMEGLPVDETQLIFGQDPMIVMFMSSFIGTGVGYLVGSWLTGAFWRLLNPEKAKTIEAYDVDYKARIYRLRGPGESQTDDYYGEKVKNLHDYHKWLKAQKKAIKKFNLLQAQQLAQDNVATKK